MSVPWERYTFLNSDVHSFHKPTVFPHKSRQLCSALGNWLGWPVMDYNTLHFLNKPRHTLLFGKTLLWTNQKSLEEIQPLKAPVLHHTACRVCSFQSGPCTPALGTLWSALRLSPESEWETIIWRKLEDSCISSRTDKAVWFHNHLWRPPSLPFKPWDSCLKISLDPTGKR